MWTVSVKAGQSELNDTRMNVGTNEETMEQTKEGTNTSRDLLKFIFRCQMIFVIEVSCALLSS